MGATLPVIKLLLGKPMEGDSFALMVVVCSTLVALQMKSIWRVVVVYLPSGVFAFVLGIVLMDTLNQMSWLWQIPCCLLVGTMIASLAIILGRLLRTQESETAT